MILTLIHVSNSTPAIIPNSILGIFSHNTDGPESGDLRLTRTNRGHMEVFLSGTWHFVADSNMSWTLNNTEVVCRQLGYDTNGMWLFNLH